MFKNKYKAFWESMPWGRQKQRDTFIANFHSLQRCFEKWLTIITIQLWIRVDNASSSDSSHSSSSGEEGEELRCLLPARLHSKGITWASHLFSAWHRPPSWNLCIQILAPPLFMWPWANYFNLCLSHFPYL